MNQEYFSATERQLSILIEQESERIREEWKKIDEETRDLAHQELYELTENVPPRFFRAPILVSLCAIYESGKTQVANHL